MITSVAWPAPTTGCGAPATCRVGPKETASELTLPPMRNLATVRRGLKKEAKVVTAPYTRRT